MNVTLTALTPAVSWATGTYSFETVSTRTGRSIYRTPGREDYVFFRTGGDSGGGWAVVHDWEGDTSSENPVLLMSINAQSATCPDTPMEWIFFDQQTGNWRGLATGNGDVVSLVCDGAPSPPPLPPSAPPPTYSCETIHVYSSVAIFGVTLAGMLGLLLSTFVTAAQPYTALTIITGPVSLLLGTSVVGLTLFSPKRISECNPSTLPAAGMCIAIIMYFSYRVFQGYREARETLLERLTAAEGTLPARLKDGSIRLLRVQWLLAQPSHWVMQRRQDLPNEAHVSTDEAVRLLAEGKVGALSYRWLTAQHPDPERLHLDALLRFFLQAPSHAAQYQAVFWDFASLPQHPRTEAETALFKGGLTCMTNLYASPRVLVLQHKGMGNMTCTFPEDPSGQADYDHSGWCTMEQAAASLTTRGRATLYQLGVGWVKRRPRHVMRIEEMAAIFTDERRTKFLGSADRELVARLYADLYHKLRAFDSERVPQAQKDANAFLTYPYKTEHPEGIHPGFFCKRQTPTDRLGKHQPISGYRYHLRGSEPTYDLCQEEFDKLPLDEAASYDRIAPTTFVTIYTQRRDVGILCVGLVVFGIVLIQTGLDGAQVFIPAPVGILAFYTLPSRLVRDFLRYKIGRLRGDTRMRAEVCPFVLRCAWHPNPPFSPQHQAALAVNDGASQSV